MHCGLGPKPGTRLARWPAGPLARAGATVGRRPFFEIDAAADKMAVASDHNTMGGRRQK